MTRYPLYLEGKMYYYDLTEDFIDMVKCERSRYILSDIMGLWTVINYNCSLKDYKGWFYSYFTIELHQI